MCVWQSSSQKNENYFVEIILSGKSEFMEFNLENWRDQLLLIR